MQINSRPQRGFKGAFMKRFVLVLALLAVGTLVFAQVNLDEFSFVGGKWEITADRLYQNDEKARLAKTNIKAPQEGAMLYEFEARYEGGAEDGHGGFGLHIFVNNPFDRVSWGAAQSILLWLNYDENPINKEIHKGFSGQVYRSINNSTMELIQSFDLNEFIELLTEENLAEPVPFKIIVDGNTGEIQIFDPTTNDGSYYQFFIDKKLLPLKGDWVVLRTNGMKMSFTN